MTLYVTLNGDGTLALESDYGGSRSVVADDSDGPTEWSYKQSWGVPDRTESLLESAIDDAVSNNNIPLAIDLAKDGICESFVDDR